MFKKVTKLLTWPFLLIWGAMLAYFWFKILVWAVLLWFTIFTFLMLTLRLFRPQLVILIFESKYIRRIIILYTLIPLYKQLRTIMSQYLFSQKNKTRLILPIFTCNDILTIFSGVSFDFNLSYRILPILLFYIFLIWRLDETLT